jgi:hypothetical protein
MGDRAGADAGADSGAGAGSGAGTGGGTEPGERMKLGRNPNPANPAVSPAPTRDAKPGTGRWLALGDPPGMGGGARLAFEVRCVLGWDDESGVMIIGGGGGGADRLTPFAESRPELREGPERGGPLLSPYLRLSSSPSKLVKSGRPGGCRPAPGERVGGAHLEL